MNRIPRQARVKCEFSIYHIMLRGNEGKKIFHTNKDKKRFIEILLRVSKKYNCIIYAYCLMGNHVHLIIDDNGNDISTIVKSIATRYAVYFNKVHERRGHLFQDRFRSEIIADDNYLLRASRYIHNNPVKAGLTNTAAEYAWSSYPDYAGWTTSHSGVADPGKVLDIISTDREKARKEYALFVNRPDAAVDLFQDMDEEKPSISNERKEYIRTLEEAGRRMTELLKSRDLNYQQTIHLKRERDSLIRELRKNSYLTQKEIGSIFALSESAVCKILNRD